MNDMNYAVFSANWQPGMPKYNWVNWQWVGFTNQNRDRRSGPEQTFSKEMIQINKYANLACFLNICKLIMVFLCFSRVKNVHTAPLILSTLNILT